MNDKKSIGGRGVKCFIVWNEARNEGVVFTDERDAKQCASGNFSMYTASALGEGFAKLYEDDKLTLERVELADA